MLKEAIAFIAELGQAEILEINGKSYSTKILEELETPETSVKPITVHSLSGLVDYIKNTNEHKKDREEPGSIVLVNGPRSASFMSTLIGEWEQRDVFITAEPFTGRDFQFGRYINTEDFVIGLQTHFVQDEQTANVLHLVGNLKAGIAKTVEDDGFSQEVTVRKGITKVENKVVASPVELRPFRTFQDVDQPASKYVLRMQSASDEVTPMVALFEVDDQLWRLAAVRAIKEYLDKSLPKDMLVLA